MKNQAKDHLESQGFTSDGILFLPSIDMRYIGQAYEVNISTSLESTNLEVLEEDFYRIYKEKYGHADKGRRLEVISFRLSAVAGVEKPNLVRYQSHTHSLQEAEIERRSVYFDGKFYDCPVYNRDLLPEGSSFTGPGVVEEAGATTVLFPSWKASLDEWGNIFMTEL